MIANDAESLTSAPKYETGLDLARGMKAKTRNYRTLISTIFYWTAAHPLLTVSVCEMIADAEDSPMTGREEQWISQLVKTRLIEKWETLDNLKHLQNIRDRLLQPKPQTLNVLRAYQQILEHERIPANDSPEQRELRMAGLAVRENGRLFIHNRIYASVFSLEWVEQAIETIETELEIDEAEFLETFSQLERKLLVSQVDFLSDTETVEEGQQSAQALYEVLRDVTSTVGQLLRAERTTIFLLNEDKTELWSLVAQNEQGEFLDIHVRVGEGIAGSVAQMKRVINIPGNVYEDPRCKLVKEYDQRYNYRTRNILAFPILDEEKNVVAVIQLLNKIHSKFAASEATRNQGFTRKDLERLVKCVIPIRQILQACQSSYRATKKLRATAALTEATRSLDQINLDTQTVLHRVMDTAKKLINADRSTLWLADPQQGDLWTELPGKGTVRCPIGVGFVGEVAESGETLNIPFDLYNDPNAENAKKTDSLTRYRTCSLLCMPIKSQEGELLGVTQLVNKRKPGNHPEYNKESWPAVPDYLKASFDRNDRQTMQLFNERVAVLLQFIRSHESLKQQSYQIDPVEVTYQSLVLLTKMEMDLSFTEEAAHRSIAHLLGRMSESLQRAIAVTEITPFIFDSSRNRFWSPIGKDGSLVTISADRGLAKTLAETQEFKGTNKLKKMTDELVLAGVKNMMLYRQLFLYPVANAEGELVGVLRLFDKRDGDRLDPKGFNSKDAQQLNDYSQLIAPMLQGFQSFYIDIPSLKSSTLGLDPLTQAINLIRNSGGTAEEIIRNVMQAAKTLTDADRSTLWLIDRENEQLWTKLPQTDGSLIDIRIPMGEGFAGRVATTGEPLNIPFDLYDFRGSEIAQQTDKRTRYRTCSLLCMPVLSKEGEVLGVTQLVNKQKPGEFSPYDPNTWPEAPEHFKTSFHTKDRENMELLNAQVGEVLPGILAD
ncbi:GAF domain-containing protein [Roseofilum casamattae]|uniref:GAF domain-containing protein n=1 Tax=Roseofilum casamattae BLCC-M143 TaxID=3022442 RepID=A0ABT7BWU1_9CYAN|nr:GAF domain-containing protein [Roseofilum casamattae]MDJ1182989.1 GAF domain-containing protein [Roseofilum casamattae BLCC-M143]